MFANYLKAYLRNLWKNRTFTFLNIIGLAVGITCSTLIFLWIEDEFNWDRQFAKKDYLYQIEGNQTYGGTTYTFSATPGPLAPSMKADIPGIAGTSPLLPGQTAPSSASTTNRSTKRANTATRPSCRCLT